MQLLNLHTMPPCQRNGINYKRSEKMRMLILIRLILIPLTLIACIPASRAQQVNKCVKGKEVSYQSAPCDLGRKLVRQWDAVPDPEPSRVQPHGRQDSQAASSQTARATNKAASRTGGGGRTRAPKTGLADRCAAAKARREAKLQSVGLKRTFDLLRKLDDAVYEACK